MKRATSAEIQEFVKGLSHSLAAPLTKKLVECLFTYELPVSPSEIWPFLIDTSRMNKDLGFPSRQEIELEGENHVTTVTFGRKEEWIEKPWVWIHEKEVQNHRIFLKGWMAEQRGVFQIEESKNHTTLVHVYFRWAFHSSFSRFLFSLVPGALSKKFESFFILKTKLILDDRGTHKKQLATKPNASDPYQEVKNYILTADPLDLDRLHVKSVSQKIGLPVNSVIDACVRLVNEGSLSLSWDVVCPHCRGVKMKNQSLSSIDDANSCEPCGITFNLEAEESIEVVFHISPKLREIQNLVYCAAEPAKKKHIKLNQEIKTGEIKEFRMNLPPGTYNLRSKNGKGLIAVHIEENSSEGTVSWDGLEKKKITVRPEFTLRVSNKTNDDDLFTFEEAWWFHDRLLAGEALSHPNLREIFSQDHISVGMKLNVGTQVILFTDIVGSTPFYKNLGDALALKAVQGHYKEVAQIIEKNGGVVVKFIGDAVMAAFLDVHKAMEAALSIQQAFHRTRNDVPIKLRVSFHEGKVLAANMNVGIDYFGNTVNQAAKIQKHAGAHEIAVTEDDYKRVRSFYPELKFSDPIRDEKLGMNVRILKG